MQSIDEVNAIESGNQPVAILNDDPALGDSKPVESKKKKVKKKVSMFAGLADDTNITNIEQPDAHKKSSLIIDVPNSDTSIRTAEADEANIEMNATQTSSTTPRITPRITPRTSPKGNNNNTNFDNDIDINKSEFNSVLELSSNNNASNNSIVLTNSQYRRYERIARRASIAMDICTGMEMYRLDSIGLTYLLTFALPTFILFIIFGLIPYSFSYWIRLFLPFANIFLVSTVLICDIYSNVISEIEFGIVIFDAIDDDNDDHFFLLLIKVFGFTLIPLIAIIFILYYCVYEQQDDMSQLYWLVILNTCSVSTILGLIKFNYLPKREISREMSSKSNQTSQSDALKSERRQQNHALALWAIGTLVMFNVVPTIYAILSNVYNAYQRHTNGFVGYVLVILIAVSPEVYLYILNNALQFGNRKGHLCCSQAVSTFVYTLHVAFLVLIGASISTYGELVVMGVIQTLILISYCKSFTFCNIHPRIGITASNDSKYIDPVSDEDSHVKLVDELICISHILTAGTILPIVSLVVSAILCAGPNYVLFNGPERISIHEYQRDPYLNWTPPTRLHTHSYTDGNAYVVKLVLMSVCHFILMIFFRLYYKKHYNIEILGAVSAHIQDYFIQMLCCAVYSCLIIFATSFDWFFI